MDRGANERLSRIETGRVGLDTAGRAADFRLVKGRFNSVLRLKYHERIELLLILSKFGG